MTNSAHPILQAMIPVADGIAKMLGNTCEVAIHDLHRPRHSIFYIVNGEITNRKVGDTLGPLFDDLSKLSNIDSESMINYYLYLNHHSLKCSKILIKDENSHIIGCLCINIVLDDYLRAKQVIDKICETTIENPANRSTNIEGTGDEISTFVSDIILNTYYEFVSSKGSLSVQDKTDMTRFLDEKGVFKVKGTVDMVADLLGVSKFSVYNYLDKAKSK